MTNLFVRARSDSGLTQLEVALLAHTSRPTLSAYEHGRKSPTIDTAQRVLAVTGHELEVVPRVHFTHHVDRRGRPFVVPDRLARLPVADALKSVAVPLHLGWSPPGQMVDLSNRSERARFYEVLLREGLADDLRTFVDGALLIDLWKELVLPRDVRRAWEPLVDALLPVHL